MGKCWDSRSPEIVALEKLESKHACLSINMNTRMKTLSEYQMLSSFVTRKLCDKNDLLWLTGATGRSEVMSEGATVSKYSQISSAYLLLVPFYALLIPRLLDIALSG